MRIIICTLFLTSAIFLNSVKLSSQAERPPSRPVGQPFLADRVPQDDNEIWVHATANRPVPMPNGGYFRARFDGMVKLFYENPQGIITVEERDGKSFLVHPAKSEIGIIQALHRNIQGRGQAPGSREGASGSGSSRQ